MKIPPPTHSGQGPLEIFVWQFKKIYLKINIFAELVVSRKIQNLENIKKCEKMPYKISFFYVANLTIKKIEEKYPIGRFLLADGFIDF